MLWRDEFLMRPWLISSEPPDVATRMPQIESWRFSQGLPCKTSLQTHSKQAMLLPSTQSSPKTREPLLFPNAPFDK
jgi:hypothetical protein